METIIKVQLSELNVSLLDKIREFIGDKKNIDITISLKEYDNEYEEELNRSIESSESILNIITFTREDFMVYTPANKSEK